MTQVGYVTGTFDILHEDHMRLLRACKQQCDTLVVGLVTDALGTRQKRTPVMLYRERRVLLENTRWVDLVVAHGGESKTDAWNKLKFDILFTTDEYKNSNEFLLFERLCPTIKVVYFPKNNYTSSSTVWRRIQERVLDESTVLAVGVGGIIIRPIDDVVIKYCYMSTAEVVAYENDNNKTGDVLHFMDVANGLLPRNDGTVPPVFPMLSGVNVLREVVVLSLMADYEWNTFLKAEIVYRDNKQNIAQQYPGPKGDLHAFARWVEGQRKYPAAILTIKQRYAGVTLRTFLQQQDTLGTLNDTVVNRVILRSIRTICNDLKSVGVVHGDIHLDNVLVNVDVYNNRFPLYDMEI